MHAKTALVLAAGFLALASSSLFAQPTTAPAKVDLPVPEALKSFKPTLVTLRLDNTPVLDALNQVGKQANVSFTIWPDFVAKEFKDKKVTANFNAIPFWTAVTEIAGQAGLAPKDVDFENHRQVSLSTREPGGGKPPVSVCGPVVVMLDSVSYSRSLDYAQPEPTSKAEVRFRYLLDPALESADFGTVAVPSEMVDTQGQSLLLQKPETEHWTSGGAGHMVGETFAHLQYLGKTAPQCRTLRGTIAGTFVLATDAWELDPAAATGQKHTVGKIDLTITKCVLTGDKCELAINIKSPFRRATDAAAGAVSAVTYTLTASDGSLWRNSGYEGGGPTSNLNYTMRFEPADKDKVSPPAKLIIRTPTQTTKGEVPFEFHDFPLP